MSDRPLRLCPACGGVDDHPRHVVTTIAQGDEVPLGRPTQEQLDAAIDAGIRGAGLQELMDPGTAALHMDCHAALGCPVCTRTEEANDGRRGAELVKHLERQVRTLTKQNAEG